MKSTIIAAIIVAIAGLVGCVSTEHKINNVSLGMNKQQIIETLGTPDNTRAAKGIEYMIYELKAATNIGECTAVTLSTFGLSSGLACGRDKVEYFVQIEQGKVTAYGQVGDFGSTELPEATININKTVKEVE